jgi:Na+/melibiose symporter-like transporter
MSDPRSRTLVGANAVMLLVGAVAVGVPSILTLYAQRVLGYPAVRFGVGSVVLAVAVAVGAIVAQAAVLKVGFQPVAASGMALLGAGSLLLTQVSVAGSYFGDIVFGLLVGGPGIGLAFVTATVAVAASGRYLAANQGADPLVVLNEGFQAAFVACVVLAGIGMALALLLLGRPQAAPQERPEATPVPVPND